MDTGGDETVDQGRSGVRGERRAETINVARMKLCRAGYIIDV